MYLPLLLVQHKWLSCMPATPIIISTRTFCAWNNHLTGVSSPDGTPGVSRQKSLVVPDLYTPQIGIWAFSQHVKMSRVQRLFFRRKGNIIMNRDCMHNDRPLLKHDISESFHRYREMNGL